MKCPRCGHRNKKASWYCAGCGAPIAEMNVADSVSRRRLPRLVLRSAAVSAAALLSVALASVGISVIREQRSGTDDGPRPTPVLVERKLASAPDARPTSPGDRALAVATASIGEATAASAWLAPTPTPGVSVPNATAGSEAESGSPADSTRPFRAGSTPPSPEILAARQATARTAAIVATVAAAAPSEDLAVILATPDSLLTPRPRVGIPSWQAPMLERRPSIDGALSEWGDEPVEISAVVFGEEFWLGPADLSATAHVGWDLSALYLGVRVVDDVFSQPGTGAELYLGDSLELQVDTLLEPDRDDGSYSRDDWQIGLSPGDFGNLGPEVFVWRPVQMPVPDVEIAARRLDDGYIVEAAIPWREMEIDPELVGAIGMALNVSDNDVEVPAQLTMISSSPRRKWADPRTFGTLVLRRGSDGDLR